MHKVARDTLRLKRWLRMAADRLELMPADLFVPLHVDSGTWGRWTSLDDERFISLGHLPTVLAQLDAQAREDFDQIVSAMVADAKNKAPEPPGA